MSVCKFNSKAFRAGDNTALIVKENIIVARAVHLAEFQYALFLSHIVYINKLRVHLIISACDNIGKRVCRVKRGKRCNAKLICSVKELNVIVNALFVALAGINNIVKPSAFNKLHNGVVLAELVYNTNLYAKAFDSPCRFGCCPNISSYIVKLFCKRNNFISVLLRNGNKNAVPFLFVKFINLEACRNKPLEKCFVKVFTNPEHLSR